MRSPLELAQERSLAWAQCYATILAGLVANPASTQVSWIALRELATDEANEAFGKVGVSV